MRDGELVAVGRPSDLKRAVDRKLRLELFTSSDIAPVLKPGIPIQRLQPGRWMALLEKSDMVISLMFGNMDNVQSHFSFIRFQGALDYFATLPIRGQILVLAVVLGLLLLSLPSLVVTLLVGSVFLRVPIAPHPIALIAIPMCAIPLSGIGALIGSMARTPQESGSWALFVTMVMAGLGPVVVLPDRLPRFLVLLGRFSPATYAASALRQAFLGPVTG